MKAKVVKKIVENKKLLNTYKNILKLRESIFVTKFNNKNKRGPLAQLVRAPGS